ncbi:peptide ABC transporter ATP-binding protein [Bacillus xiamenensis]|uniref:Dipeptide/oligopeptide/nickel ABC transporter ATP-binding protein n=1 Tax=Bacillus xiamenensis TaxID=1178537 RepID=A0AAC9ILC6_9BACI|nr:MULTISPECIES: dipeptide/oligopeptide/nickel ABC transporter ATP-binding protein [Bacillus]AOZ89224.1 peptide ABC transporter ATP-binding protein [Bacillus xiamenensis]EKF33893.1 ABC transporter ATP-binding protein [Bacillus xiamenensis]MBG9912032.1 peptide ABC transporter ATP-binding protein [Bacillus xiamenensis]MCW1835179.1 dipeptide/oligopeptide/nickel ABC transporter ATP-binding protein [Bacillus xiamenensis]MCY9576226.1 dipeptide/oligopeptide/nickel ABC transporter ATP-binding protein 
MLITVHQLQKNGETKGFFSHQKKAKARISNVSFQIEKGQCVGVVGESGSGKSTLARILLGLEKKDGGEIQVDGRQAHTWRKVNRGKMSVVFQDYLSSVHPAFTVKEIIAEPMRLLQQGKNVDQKVLSLLEQVRLPSSLLNQYAHQLSGGQLQRVCIARAVSTNPSILILDEVLSSLDVSVQVQILELLETLKQELDMTILMITHDIEAAVYLCDRLLFLHEGTVVEDCKTDELYEASHPFTLKLLDSLLPFQHI